MSAAPERPTSAVLSALSRCRYYENGEGGHGGAADNKQQAFMATLAYNFLWEALTKPPAASASKL